MFSFFFFLINRFIRLPNVRYSQSQPIKTVSNTNNLISPSQKTNVNTKKATAESKKYTESEKNKRSEDGGLNNRKAESPV